MGKYRLKKHFFIICFAFASLFLCLLFFSSCAPVAQQQYVKNGKPYGVVQGAFRHRWWNYYERGLSFMEGEFYPQAASDLQKAIEKRFADNRSARTYGMHFIDYFPHRELGLVFYLTQQYEAAMAQFQISMDQQPSAKARYYIDKIRKIMLQREMPPISIPDIRLARAQKEIWTRKDPFPLSVFVFDSQYVSKLTINDKPVYLEAAESKVEVVQAMDLEPGENRIAVYAQNLMEKSAVRELIVHLDQAGPVIHIDPESVRLSGGDEIKGVLQDDSGSMKLRANGREVPLNRGKQADFTLRISPSWKELALEASDRLGNETNARINLKELMAGGPAPMLAVNGQSDLDPFYLAFSVGGKRERKPVLKVPGWAHEQTVFLDRVFIEGEARDSNDIIDLTINREPVLRRPGKMIFFNHLLNLKAGENLVQIAATNKNGKTMERVFSITRQVPRVFQVDSRFSLTPHPFVNKGNESGLNEMFYYLFLSHLMDRNRFKILEREHLDKILEEQKLSATSLVNRKTALETGRLAAAQATLAGNFIETRIGIEVVARVIDNETSEVLAIKDVYDEFKDRRALAELSEGLSVKLHHEFPLVDGLVVDRKQDTLITDMGREKIKTQRRLIIYREGEPVIHPLTGKTLGRDAKIVGYARTMQVMENMSKAEIIQSVEGDPVQSRDKVMTQ